MDIVIRITSQYCIGAYLAKGRELAFTDILSKARRFTHADKALKVAQRIPSPIAHCAPATTFELVRVQ
jgi:hypothetical protein